MYKSIIVFMLVPLFGWANNDAVNIPANSFQSFWSACKNLPAQEVASSLSKVEQELKAVMKNATTEQISTSVAERDVFGQTIVTLFPRILPDAVPTAGTECEIHLKSLLAQIKAGHYAIAKVDHQSWKSCQNDLYRERLGTTAQQIIRCFGDAIQRSQKSK